MVRHNKLLPVAISESNFATDSDSNYVTNRALHYQKRTFPLVLSTLALIRNPDKVLFRMLFDYKVSIAVRFGMDSCKTLVLTFFRVIANVSVTSVVAMEILQLQKSKCITSWENLPMVLVFMWIFHQAAFWTKVVVSVREFQVPLLFLQKLLPTNKISLFYLSIPVIAEYQCG